MAFPSLPPPRGKSRAAHGISTPQIPFDSRKHRLQAFSFTALSCLGAPGEELAEGASGRDGSMAKVGSPPFDSSWPAQLCGWRSRLPTTQTARTINSRLCARFRHVSYDSLTIANRVGF